MITVAVGMANGVALGVVMVVAAVAMAVDGLRATPEQEQDRASVPVSGATARVPGAGRAARREHPPADTRPPGGVPRAALPSQDSKRPPSPDASTAAGRGSPDTRRVPVTTTDNGPIPAVTDELRGISTGIEQMTAWLAENWSGDLPTPYITVAGCTVTVQVRCDDSAELAAVARCLTAGAPIGAVTKRPSSYADGKYMQVIRRFGPVVIEAWALRDDVCTARVVGTETVEVPDPNAPKITVERDVIEWDCSPLLAGTGTGA